MNKIAFYERLYTSYKEFPVINIPIYPDYIDFEGKYIIPFWFSWLKYIYYFLNKFKKCYELILKKLGSEIWGIFKKKASLVYMLSKKLFLSIFC
jgi:hypothetical protein